MHLVGHPAPLFDSPAFQTQKSHHMVSLEALKGKWVLLAFYPLNFSSTCPLELKELKELHPKFDKLGCEVLSVSVDSTYAHEAWCTGSLGEMPFSMVSDLTKRMCRDYGVLEEERGVALRGTFFIDPDGLVQAHLCHNLKTQRNFKELLETLKKLQTL